MPDLKPWHCRSQVLLPEYWEQSSRKFVRMGIVVDGFLMLREYIDQSGNDQNIVI